MTNPYKEHALKLIGSGEYPYAPIPLNGKAPVVKGWQALRGITAEQIETWDKSGLWRNIGIVCGEASGNLVVIDFDGLGGYDLFCKQFADLADTYTVATGSGKGMHCYYRVDLLPGSESYMDILLDGGELVNIEFKADGKQVVIPPSLHPETQQPYTVHKRVNIKRLTDLAPVQQWLRGLTGRDWQPPTPRISGVDPLNPRVVSELTGYFRAQPHKENGDWINCSCPNQAAHQHGDKAYSFGYNVKSGSGYCYRCGWMKTKQLCEYAHIDYADLGGLFENTYAASGNGNGMDRRPAANGYMPAPEPTPLKVVTRQDILETYLRGVLDPNYHSSVPPVPFPLKVLHQFGGMAHVARAGKIAAIVGVSGTGKTSLLEMMVDAYLMMGVGVLLWSPEWTPEEFIDRAIQRYGGPSVTELWLHDVYKWEKAQGKSAGFIGKPLFGEHEAKIKQTYSVISSWTGQIGYIDSPTLKTEQLEAQLPITLSQLPFAPRVLMLDYVQLMHACEKQDMSMYDLIMRLKAICAANGLFGICATQTTKAAAKDNKKHGEILDTSDARFVNDDAFNMFLTINAEWIGGLKTDSAVLNVAKNSLGTTGKVRVKANWSRLWFSDTPHQNQDFEE